MKSSALAGLLGSIALAVALAPVAVSPTPAQAQEMSAADRRFYVATAGGFDFDERAALAALAEGADINHRNPAMDEDTVLIAAIRAFKDPAMIKWLLDHGADPSLTNNQGRNAAYYFTRAHMDRTAEGKAILARLGGGDAAAPAAGAAPAPTRAPAYTPPPAAAAPRNPVNPAGGSTPTAAFGPPQVPGVYECLNQQGMISPMAFGLIDGSTYTTSGGRRGPYTYNAATGVLTLDTGANAARYQRAGPTWFRPLLPNGQLGGFSCPLNRAKSPTRLPW